MKKLLLIGGGIILAVVIVGAVLIYSNKDKLVNFAIEKGFGAAETAILENLPQSVSEDEVKSLFNKSVEKIKSGNFDKQKMQGIVLYFQDAFQDKKLEQSEVDHLLDELKQFVEE